MKRFEFALLLIALVSISASAQESLGDAAKKAQAQKKPQATKVYTNDDIPSVMIPASEKSSSSAITDDKKSDKAAKGDKADKNDGKKESEAAKKAVADQKAKVADIEREVSLMEREHQVRVAAYYADAGNQLRDSTKWFADEKKYQEDLTAKQKSLSDAKDKLAQIQEDARKAGVPMSQIE